MKFKISTTTEQDFIYPYKQTKFAPPEGKTLLIMGQTFERITEYVKEFGNETLPGGWSAYWGIPEFRGIRETFKNETGSSQNHQYLVDNFPNTVLQSALWIVGHDNIALNATKGKYDQVIINFAKWAKSVNRPIYLRIGYEFDGIHNALEPDLYIILYRRVVDIIRSENVDNVAFVWHSYASKPYKDYPVSAWYPGDEYVDWVAISVFGHAYENTDFGHYCDDVLQFAKTHYKPVMIAESSPINGIDEDNSEVWNNWFVNFFSFIYNKNIKAVSFINEDWTSLEIVGISEWKNSLLQNNTSVAEAWFEETEKLKYLKQSSGLFRKLGFKRD